MKHLCSFVSRPAIGFLFVCTLALSASAASSDPMTAPVARGKAMKPQFWFEDSNQGEAGGYPPDFREMFERPETWKELRARIDVYYIRGTTLRNLFNDLGEPFMRDYFAKVLKDAKIPVAIDNISNDISYIQKLSGYGVNVS